MTDEVKKFIEPLRISILKNSDFTQLADAPLTVEQKAAWATYRQAIRDLPASEANASVDTVDAVVWPTQPA